MTAPTAALAEQIDRHATASRMVCQSWLIHPDWDLDTHLAYVEQETGWTADTPLTVVAWPSGPSTDTLQAFVAMWLRIPERSFEHLR